MRMENVRRRWGVQCAMYEGRVASMTLSAGQNDAARDASSLPVADSWHRNTTFPIPGG